MESEGEGGERKQRRRRILRGRKENMEERESTLKIGRRGRLIWKKYERKRKKDMGKENERKQNSEVKVN
jgi:hypothetical protein